MLFWVEWITVWTLGYAMAYTVMRPEILRCCRAPQDDPWVFQVGLPVWTSESAQSAKQHYKAYIPVGIAAWIVLFMLAVEGLK